MMGFVCGAERGTIDDVIVPNTTRKPVGRISGA
jgi:hypothetical protein